MSTSPTDESGPRRTHLLIDGRRVRISDLMQFGLLAAGEELDLERRRLNEFHTATVTPAGRIRLSDGQEFDTPSGAAVAVTDVPTDGWNSWRTREGRYLSALRADLLARLEAERTSTEPVEDAPGARFRQLVAAGVAADEGTPRTLAVRELLRLWGAQERDRTVSQQIDADLANHGLITEPDYRAVNLETAIRLVRPPGPDSEPIEEPAVTHPPPTKLGEEETPDDIGLTLGNLVPEGQVLGHVSPSASLEQAITMMSLNDYSQVAVLSDERTLRGAVSWKSIARSRHANPDAGLSDAIIRGQTFDYDARLLEVLDVLQREEFIFVRSFDRRIYGVVTAADVVRTYDETATPFFLIGETDQELRRLIEDRFELAELQHLFRDELESFDRMSMGHYQAVLSNKACWAKLQWPLDRSMFIDQLNEIREIRNTVMHFNPDPIPSAAVDRIRYFLDVIRLYGR